MPKLLFNAVLISAALVLESAATLRLLEGYLSGSGLTLFCLHLSASATLAVALSRLVAARYQTPTSLIALFFFMLAFFIPMLGALGLIMAVLPGFRAKNSKNVLSMHTNKIRTFYDTTYVEQDLQPVTGRAVNLENLLRSHDPKKRMSAVYATLKIDDKDAIPLLRIALRDPVDDIRLLAYALIDRKEQRISERIEIAKHRLESGEGGDTRHLYKNIVKDYWELVHLGLVEGETLNFVLSKARDYIETGLQLYPKDRGLHLQYAKLLLRLGKDNAAYDEFKLAENLGIGRQNLLLYYAEIAFLHHRFGEVKQYMKELEAIKARPEIQASTHYWQGHGTVAC